MKPDEFIAAARCPRSLQPQKFGDQWSINRQPIPNAIDWGGFRDYTLLQKVTWGGLHIDGGEIVMEDSPIELRKHLPIWLSAHGRVLVTGLGLGCVVRGLLAKPTVTHIDVVEINPDILRIVGAEFRENERVSLHLGDALEYDWPGSAEWDCAWHDLWIEGDGLALLHAKLIQRHEHQIQKQGAWAFPRWVKRAWPQPLLGACRQNAA